MIHGYRTVFDMGGLINPLAQVDAAHSKRVAEPQTGSGTSSDLQPVAGADRAIPAPKTVKAPQTAVFLGSGEDPTRATNQNSGKRDVAEEPSDTARQRQEPSLPQLSAEALATALMTAEPDKALVPRVLPADPTQST
ncbi:MAG: hypothetical protein QNJ03_13905 [Dinoroseobacter sp.]|nr:hypothetical protein [Dinoroseobacter sp.]